MVEINSVVKILTAARVKQIRKTHSKMLINLSICVHVCGPFPFRTVTRFCVEGYLKSNR